MYLKLFGKRDDFRLVAIKLPFKQMNQVGIFNSCFLDTTLFECLFNRFYAEQILIKPAFLTEARGTWMSGYC